MGLLQNWFLLQKKVYIEACRFCQINKNTSATSMFAFALQHLGSCQKMASTPIRGGQGGPDEDNKAFSSQPSFFFTSFPLNLLQAKHSNLAQKLVLLLCHLRRTFQPHLELAFPERLHVRMLHLGLTWKAVVCSGQV